MSLPKGTRTHYLEDSEMKKIEAFEKAIENKIPNLREAGINPTLFWAYRTLEETGNERIDFNECIWEHEIEDIAKCLKENGIYQAMIYPRSGCELEYLSNEWFDTIEKYIISAQKLNMNIWLYDDFNWPSGDACGKVTKIKDFRLKSITISGEKTGEISYHSTHNASLFGEKFFPDLLNNLLSIF